MLPIHLLFLSACSTLVTVLNAEEENDPPTYKDAFPPLPEKAACLEPAQEPAGAWSKIRPIKASVITQVSAWKIFLTLVFHYPCEMQIELFFKVIPFSYF